jgi:hypothetical protein
MPGRSKAELRVRLGIMLCAVSFNRDRAYSKGGLLDEGPRGNSFAPV